MEWYDFLNPHEQKEYECSECGKPLETDKVIVRELVLRQV